MCKLLLKLIFLIETFTFISINSWAMSEALLTDEKLTELSTSQIDSQNIKNLKIVTDNDQAFLDKLELIDDSTESIDAIYYIWSDDATTSVINKKIIEAAQRNVNVRILVDLLQNYNRLDMFNMLIEKGGKNLAGEDRIQVRFYGRPTRNVVLGATYMTLDCGDKFNDNENPKACANVKLPKVDALFENETQQDRIKNISTLDLKNLSPLTAQFLAGLYAKNGDLIVQSVLKGQKLSKEKLDAIRNSGDSSTNEDVEKLKEFMQLIKKAKFGSGIERIVANLELYVSFKVYGDDVNPIYNLLSGLIPLDLGNSKAFNVAPEERSLDWEYLTDFIHHKFLFSDKQNLVMGGRNLENSYHMKANKLSSKYTFMDTDLTLELNHKDIKLSHSFDKLWEHEVLVASIVDLEKIMPYEWVANYNYAKKECLIKMDLSGSEIANIDLADTNVADSDLKKQKNLISECINTKINSGFKVSLKQRLNDQWQLMNKNIQSYESLYTPSTTDPVFKLSSSDVQTVKLYYLENLTFDKKLKAGESKRIHGAKDGKASLYGRYLHETWMRSLLEVCSYSEQTKTQQDVYIHNAYLAPPSVLLTAFGKMVDGSLPCGRVKVNIITNSIATTDLSPVNAFGIYAMKAFYDYYKQNIEQNSKCKIQLYADGTTQVTNDDLNQCAQFNLMEYIGQDMADKKKSLHTKVTVFGSEHILVGSSNADFRSYMMDTNNAMLIRNAPHIVEQYTLWLKNEIIREDVVQNLNAFLFFYSFDQLNTLQASKLDEVIHNREIDKRYKPDHIQFAKSKILLVLKEVYDLSLRSVKAIQPSPYTEINDQAEERKKQEEMNLLDRLFKLI
ncbi:MAG: hypothetical protein H6625_09175 [Bdellovibrionaceae bacterium]|nr:hypothetical protein [Pseudobdellovibrionaceae bacterium]